MLLVALRRLGATIPVMLVVAVVVFLMLHLSNGDPAAIIAGDNASTDEIERLRTTLGLDQPLIQQFARWIWQLCEGDLGRSIFKGEVAPNKWATSCKLDHVSLTRSLCLHLI